MISRRTAELLDRLAALVTGRRALVLVPLLVVTGLVATRVPSLKMDPTPERLLSSYEGEDDKLAENFSATFDDTDKVLAVLLESEDVLGDEELQHIHQLSVHFREQDWVERAESITVVSIPRFAKQDPDDVPSLEELEAELDGDGAQAEPLEGSPRVLDALSDLVDSAPERFPDGLGGLASRLEGELEKGPVVEGEHVEPAEAEALRRLVPKQELIQGRLVSADRTVAIVALRLGSDQLDHDGTRRALRAAQRYLADHPPPQGAEVHLAGLPYLRSSIVEKMRSDQLLLLPLTLLVCMLLLYLSFRWVAGMILPIGAVLITAILVVGGMAIAHEPMNILTNIVPALLVIIGISDSIHLIGRYREELASGGSVREAGRQTVRSMAVACFLTSVTTSVGLASLVVSKTAMLRNFGIIAALGVMVAYLVTITFLPSVLTAVRRPAHVERMERYWVENFIVLLTQAVLRRPWFVLAATTLLLGVSLWGASRVRIDHALLDQFDDDDPVHRTTRLMEQKLDGIRPLEVSLSSPEASFHEPELLDKLARVQAWAEQRREVIRALGPGELLHETWSLLTEDEGAREEPFTSREQVSALATLLAQREPDPLRAFMAQDREAVRLQLRLRDVGAQETLQFIDDLEERLGAEFADHPNLTFSFAGDAYVGSRGLKAVVHDLLGSLLTAVAIIFVLLTLLFRSLRLGLLSIPPNIIPLAVTMAYMVARDIPLNAATVIIFSISIGLAVDGTIHVLARYREETLKGLGSSEALLRAARGTGQAIVVSCVTLMLGFAVLLMSSFVPVRNFGELIAVTVGGCLLATLVVQPALLKIAGLPRRAEIEAASL